MQFNLNSNQTRLLFVLDINYYFECYQWHFIWFCNHANFLTPVRLCIATPAYEHYNSDEQFSSDTFCCCYQILILTQTSKKLNTKKAQNNLCVCFQLRHMTQKWSKILQRHTTSFEQNDSASIFILNWKLFCINIHPVHPKVNLNNMPKCFQKSHTTFSKSNILASVASMRR